MGSVGVDDTALLEEGLTVKEIYSGCVCCSLRMDLVTALLEIERDYDPDLVILEPSGVAGPKQVINALAGYGGEIASKRLLSVVDASRFEAIQDMSIPLVTNGIEVAGLVVAEWPRLLDLAATELLSAGCTLIGHMKAVIKSDRGGYLVVSKTDVDQPAQTRGRLPKSFTELSVTVNAIVYRITGDRLTGDSIKMILSETVSNDKHNKI